MSRKKNEPLSAGQRIEGDVPVDRQEYSLQLRFIRATSPEHLDDRPRISPVGPRRNTGKLRFPFFRKRMPQVIECDRPPESQHPICQGSEDVSQLPG